MSASLAKHVYNGFLGYFKVGILIHRMNILLIYDYNGLEEIILLVFMQFIIICSLKNLGRERLGSLKSKFAT